MPPRLFKYEPNTLQSLRNLKTQTIFFGSPRNFNDPYDCALAPRVKSPTSEQIARFKAKAAADRRLAIQGQAELWAMTDEEIAGLMLKIGTEVMSKSVQDFLERKGVTCFSELNDNLLMWSHYASRGQGFCLEFETSYAPFEKFRKVEYASDLPEIDLTESLLDSNFDQVLRLYCTKSIHWEYEREWRGIHSVAGTCFTYDAKSLKAIYFGTEAPDDFLEIACLILQGQNSGVRFFKASRSDSTFGLHFTEITYTSFLNANGGEHG